MGDIHTLEIVVAENFGKIGYKPVDDLRMRGFDVEMNTSPVSGRKYIQATQGPRYAIFETTDALLAFLAGLTWAERAGNRGASAHAGVDWAAADWAKSDADLAATYGVSRQAARAARMRHNKS